MMLPNSKTLGFVLAVLVPLVAILALGFGIITSYRRRVREPGSVNAEMLEQFREAYEEGALDEEEFRRIQDLLSRGSGGPPAPGALPSDAEPPEGGDAIHSGAD